MRSTIHWVAGLLIVTAGGVARADEDGSQDKRARHEAMFEQLDANDDGSLTRDEIGDDQRRLLERLMDNADADDDGRLSRDEFLSGLSDRRPRRSLEQPLDIPGLPGDRPEADVIFRRLDTNGDGQLTADEGNEPQRQIIARIIENADESGDDALNPQEFGRAVYGLAQRAPDVLRMLGGERDRRDGGPREPGPLMRAIDADGDGELSADEIARAADVLKRLDRDGDGRLSRRELGPPPGGDTPGRPQPEAIVARIMQADADGDGRISRDEAPERLARTFDRVDADGDDFLDRSELGEAIRALGGRRPQGDARRRKPGDRPNR